MSPRILLAVPALALVLAATPAAARDGGMSRMAEKMRDPATQRALAAAVAAMSDAMLDMPLEPFARAAEAVGDRRAARKMHGATLRDVAGPDAERMPRELRRKLPAMMGAAGGMAWKRRHPAAGQGRDQAETAPRGGRSQWSRLHGHGSRLVGKGSRRPAGHFADPRLQASSASVR